MQSKSKISLIFTSILFLGLQNSASAAEIFTQSLQQTRPSQLLAQSNLRYRVFVNGNSRLLLEQVQKIAPDAFTRQDGQRDVIQAGAFDNRRDARERVQELENIGIQARIQEGAVPITSYNPNRPNDQWDYDSTGYFVVIPAPERNLQDIQEQVRRLALRQQQDDPAVRWRNQPRGSHVIVGPFDDRAIAERWNRYLKDFGLSNARVYYGK
ncbi:hypothetical protein NG798_19120 [Ancylothrix sp. C2]|uniref:SPOR domain-containing protein n=1 Tax=Ancylothrix sp. D3o TaxID=2953691 RepID=UPI0021BAA5A2|nr:hypothetical protein [Ancylothrix sp. D3o]MCT7951917.1 hypothetical protein [Ancylothrix sp. D3o]